MHSAVRSKTIFIMNTDLSTKGVCNFNSTVNVTLSDFILTPLSAASLINEILKNLLYQKAQMPYPYAWLKNIINKKRRSLEETGVNKKNNFTLDRHYQTVSSTYDALENIMRNISSQLVECNNLREIVFVFGVTPVCPKEVFTIKIPSLARDHSERNHAMNNNKKQSKVLRDIFMSKSWMGSLDNSLSCTNTYIFLKKYALPCDKKNLCNDDIFIPSKPLFVPAKVKHTVISLNYSGSQLYSCCDNLEIFEDSCDIEGSRKIVNSDLDHNNDLNTEEIWLQSKVLVQGFKDCFINKVSACELW